MSSRMDSSMPVTALACTHRLIRFSAAWAVPSPIAASPSGSSSRRSECAIGPSITALVSSGITISEPTDPIASVSIRASCQR